MKRDDFSLSARCIAETQLPTKWGKFRVLGFERPARSTLETAVVLIVGDVLSRTPLVRIHSECFTGDVFGSQRCDCGEQLDRAMRAISAEGAGIVIYERQEGRGIGLMAKLRAYELQDQGLDTVEANEHLGFEADSRDYVLPTEILRHLGICCVRLLTNNPEKIAALKNAGIQVVERVDCEITPSVYSVPYLFTKKTKMGHILSAV